MKKKLVDKSVQATSEDDSSFYDEPDFVETQFILKNLTKKEIDFMDDIVIPIIKYNRKYKDTRKYKENILERARDRMRLQVLLKIIQEEQEEEELEKLEAERNK